jgi:hypothetical protein
MGRPKPFKESIRQFLSNPLGLTADDLLQEEKVTIPIAIACWCGGLLICWLGGWVKADEEKMTTLLRAIETHRSQS